MTALETFVDSSPSLVKFWFYTDKIVSTGWQDLVPRQRICDCSGSTLIEDFVIRCFQIANFYCTRNTSLTAPSARTPRNFGLQAYVAISVYREVSINTVFPICQHVCKCFRI